MNDFLTSTIDSLGYVGVALLMLLENIVPPIPSEVVMPAAGAAARSGGQSLWGMIVAGTVGSVLGALPWYAIARYWGTERFQQWADRYGFWLGTDGGEIRRADAWFDRYGPWTVLFCRLIPGIRTLISIPAGLAEMPIPRFLVVTTIGTAAWSALLAGLGYWLQGQQHAIAQTVKWAGAGVVGLLVVLYVVKILRRVRARRRNAG